MKPTYGAVSRYGLIAFASSLDQIGPFATTVDDAALLLEAIWGHDPRDSTSIDRAAPAAARRRSTRGVDGLRVGLVEELIDVDGIEPDGARRGRARRPARSTTRARRSSAVSVPSTMYGLVGVLPDRAGRGVVEPRALRRRALRAARRRATTSRR